VRDASDSRIVNSTLPSRCGPTGISSAVFCCCTCRGVPAQPGRSKVCTFQAEFECAIGETHISVQVHFTSPRIVYSCASLYGVRRRTSTEFPPVLWGHSHRDLTDTRVTVSFRCPRYLPGTPVVYGEEWSALQWVPRGWELAARLPLISVSRHPP